MNLNNITFLLQDLVYYPTRTQNPVLMRPYVFNVDSSAIERIGDQINQTKSGSITPNMLSGLTSGIVQPSTVGYDSTLNQNWVSVRRFLFMLKVSHVDHMGNEINSYIFGYTEHDGITPQGNIDSSMMHYINNVIETSVYYMPTPLGTKRVEKLHNVYTAIYSTSDASVYTQRPIDLYQTVALNEMAGFMPETVDIKNAGNLITPFSNNVVTSAVDNGITTEYLSKILTSGMHAIKSQEIHVNSYSLQSDDPAEKFFREPHISESQFLRHLSKLGGSRVTNPYFSFSNLMMVDTTIYDRFKLYNLTNDFASPILSKTPESGDTWHGQDMVTIKAFSLMENSVSMATKYGFTKLSFIASNMTDPTGAITVTMLDFNSFLVLSQQDFNYLLNIFESKFRTDIFMSETNSGRVPMFMECHVNLLGTSKIYLEYAGYPGNWFTVPTYASSLYTSVMSTDQNTVDYSASQLGNALSSLAEAHTPTYY